VFWWFSRAGAAFTDWPARRRGGGIEQRLALEMLAKGERGDATECNRVQHFFSVIPSQETTQARLAAGVTVCDGAEMSSNAAYAGFRPPARQDLRVQPATPMTLVLNHAFSYQEILSKRVAP
jgi:hypothetical protein